MTETCLYCGKQLRKAQFHDGLGYDGNGIFCTLRCGFAWAVRRVRQGQGS